MSDEVTMVERTVKHKVVTYHYEKPEGVRADGSLGPVVVERQARRGETIELREPEAFLLDELGAFYSDEELDALRRAQAGDPEATDTPEPTVVDLTELDVDAIRSWLQGQGPGSKPSIPNVLNTLDAIEDEEEKVEAAERVKEAETSKEGADARSSLVGKLDALIDEDEEEE